MTNDKDISNIDAAIRKAQERKAMKQKAAGAEPTTDAATDAAPAPEAKPAKVSRAKETPEAAAERKAKAAAELEALKAAKAAELEKQKAAKAEERAAKKLEKQKEREAKLATRKTPHMSKVEKAAAKLPPVGEKAKQAIDDITANFDAVTVAAIAAHLQHFNRAKSTERALGKKVAVGDTVTIVSGDARFVGMTGTVTKAQRIRCYVEVPGAKKPIYLFLSDVAPFEAASAEEVIEAKSA